MQSTAPYLKSVIYIYIYKIFFKTCLILHSGEGTETDSEVEDRVDGVKSWLSKNKGSSKTLSDEGSLKSTRLVLACFITYLMIV